MARGTSYTIYNTVPGSKIDIEKSKDLILKNWNGVNNLCSFQENTDPMRLKWANVPDVFCLDLATDEKYVEKGLVEDDYAPAVERRYVRKSDGQLMYRIASWSFCSSSIFMLDDIFSLHYPEETVLSSDTVSKYLEAVNLAIDYNPKGKRSKPCPRIAEAMHRNKMLDAMIRAGYAPFPSIAGTAGSGYDEEESVIMSVKAIFEAYEELCKSDNSYSNPSEMVLTVVYWG